MTTGRRTPYLPPRRETGLRLGERLRQLRVAAGLTQSELAGERFSKEYVSQIERGKTRPTRETVEWLAARLGVDPGFLANGVATDERGRLEAALARAETLLEAGHNDEGAAEYDLLVPAARATGLSELEARALLGAGRAQIRLGALRQAFDLLNEARGIVEASSFSDLERAEVLHTLGICRYQLNSIQTSLGLLNEALALAERSGLPCDSLRSSILSWRSRCWRRQRDYEAAREDIERALQLAEDANDPRTIGAAYFQASLVADREGHWVLARTYAEKARAAYEELVRPGPRRPADEQPRRPELPPRQDRRGDRAAQGGVRDRARHRPRRRRGAGRVLAGPDPSAHGQHRAGRGAGAPRAAAARRARGLSRRVGNAQLVLGRALLEQGRLDEAETAFGAAEASFDQLGSASHRAAAWVARGDLAARRGDDRLAAHLYRTAAEALQDVRF